MFMDPFHQMHESKRTEKYDKICTKNPETILNEFGEQNMLFHPS